MKWFSFSYVKSNPWLFVGIVIVFGLIFWFLFNRGGSTSSGGSTIVTSGQSEAELAAATSLGMAQLQASVANQQGQMQLAAIQEQGDIAIAIAQMEAVLKGQELSITRDVAEMQSAAQVKALELQYQGQLASNQTAIDYARLAYDSATEQTKINAALQMGLATEQSDLQRDLSAGQLEAFKLSSLISVLPSLKKKNRDETLQIIAGGALGIPTSYNNTPTGTWIHGSNGTLPQLGYAG